jgi:hypothetical protein
MGLITIFYCMMAPGALRTLFLSPSTDILPYKNVTLLFVLLPSADHSENKQRHYKIYSVLVPICTVAAVVKQCANVAGEVFGVNQILIPYIFYNNTSKKKK